MVPGIIVQNDDTVVQEARLFATNGLPQPIVVPQ
jgi:hypothetical protein